MMMVRTTALLAGLALAVTACASVPETGTPSREESAVVEGAGLQPVTQRCAAPDGFSVAYPRRWSTNSGAVVAPCTFFAPDPFLVGSGPGLRAAPIRVAVEPGGFAPATTERAGEQQRSGTVIAGRRAVRILRTATGQGLWPVGTTVVSYVVDLADAPAGSGGTLVLDLVGLPQFDLAAAVPVLDRMARSVQFGDGQPSGVVARYATGPASGLVRARPSAGRVCLARPPLPRPRCFAVPEAAAVQYAGLGPGRAPSLVGGVAGGAVFRVVVQRRSGPALEYLPVPVAPDVATKGWAVRAEVGRVTGVAWYDAQGRKLGQLPARGLPGDPSQPPTRPTA